MVALDIIKYSILAQEVNMKVVVDAVLNQADYANCDKLERTIELMSKGCNERDLSCGKNTRSNPPSC